MSYEFVPSIKASMTVRRVPDPPKATGDIYPDVPAELFAPSLERRMGVPLGSDTSTSLIRALLLGLAAAEADRALVRKKGKRLDGRYGVILAVAALIGWRI